MVEQNPSQVIPTISCSSSKADEVFTMKGRRRKTNDIEFAPQSQSVISKIIKLKRIKADSNTFVAAKGAIVHRPSSPVFETNQKKNHEGIVQQKHMKTEQNSLHVKSAADVNYERCNKKGRPQKGNVVQFGPQPQSMVSKYLSKLKADYHSQIADEEHGYNDIPPIAICIPEPDQGKESDYPLKPKRRKKSKNVKELSKPRIYTCDYENCSYLTKLSSNMTKHKRVHTGEKPYLCDRCSFRSNFINSLKSHKRLHTKVRPYKCSECGYSCNSISNLKKHSHTRHKNPPNSNV